MEKRSRLTFARGTMCLIFGLQGAPVCAQGPIFLSAKQFVDAKLPASVEAIRPQLREQLRATFPAARSDTGPINWDRDNFRVELAGAPLVTFDIPVWERKGMAAMPIIKNLAAEAYFNCTTQAESRNWTSSDVKTDEAERTRTLAASGTDRVKGSVSLSLSPLAVTIADVAVQGGLGGEAGLELERTLQQSSEFVDRTKTTLESTRTMNSQFTIAKLSMRFVSYQSQLRTDVYTVQAKATFDAPIKAVYRRPAYSVDHGRFRCGATGLEWCRHTTHYPDRDFEFDLGKWGYYYPPAQRSVIQVADVSIERETVFFGPLEKLFGNASQCYAARRLLEENNRDPASLVDVAQRVARR